MGMYINESIINKYRVQKEQTVFESLFYLDYKEILNEIFNKDEDNIAMKVTQNQIRELGELSDKLPKGLNKNDEKIKYLINKFKYNDGGKSGFEFIFINVKEETNLRNLNNDFNNYDDKSIKNIKTLVNNVLCDCLYKVNKSPEIYIENLYIAEDIFLYISPCLNDIIGCYLGKTDDILNNIKTLSRDGTRLSNDKILELTKEVDKLKLIQNIFPHMVSEITHIHAATYKMLLFSLKYLTSGKMVKEDADLLFESISYEVDYDFGIL